MAQVFYFMVQILELTDKPTVILTEMLILKNMVEMPVVFLNYLVHQIILLKIVSLGIIVTMALIFLIKKEREYLELLFLIRVVGIMEMPMFSQVNMIMIIISL